jgi:hypothetical protein
MLRKMLLEYIVRSEEVREFEEGLDGHQKAVVEGGGTVLERAVREHNVGACGKVSQCIHFRGGDVTDKYGWRVRRGILERAWPRRAEASWTCAVFLGD